MEKVEEEERGTLRGGQVREDIQRIGAVVLSRLKNILASRNTCVAAHLSFAWLPFLILYL